MKLDRDQLTETLQSKNAYLIVMPIFALLLGMGCSAPAFTEVLVFKADASERILTNLLTGFIAIPSTVLAIAAVLFAILQMANRKITFVQLIFENSGIIPVIYWATLNCLVLVFLQLFGDSMSEFWLLRLLTCLSYNMVLLMIGLFYTLFRTFRYLDYTHITDDYISNINRLVRKELSPASEELDHQQLRQRGKEVYAEVTDAVAKDDAVLINKFLKSFAYALSVNPSSNYITDFNTNLAGWIVKALRLRSRLLGPLIEFWRTQFSSKFTGTINFRFDNIDRVPMLAYKLAEKEAPLRTTVVEVFSIRLKEMAQKQVYLAQTDGQLRADANFDKLFPLYIEFSELLRYLAEASDLAAIKILLNDIRMMRETLIDGSYRAVRNQVMVNRARNQQEQQDIEAVSWQRYLVVQKILREIDMIVIGNMSWLYFRFSANKLTLESYPALPSVLELLHAYFRGEETLENFVYLYNQEDSRMLWEDWIWQGEERLSGQAYAIASISDLLAAGFAGLLLRQQGARLGRHLVTSMEQLRFLLDRSRVVLTRMRQEPGNWPVLFTIDPATFPQRIDAVFAMLDGLEHQIEDEQTAELARTPVSPERVQAFKDLMAQQWEESRDLSRVFEHFAAVEVNPEQKLVDGGDNINLTKGKVMFVDGPQYNFIYGMQFGNRVNDSITYRLAEIAGAVAEDRADASLAEIFERGMNALAAAGHPANVILVDQSLFYMQEISLSTTGKYSSINNHQNPYDFSIAGFYNNNIPIIPVTSYSFGELIIIAQLPNGLVMQQRQQEDYHGRNLILEINGVDEARAQQLIAERQGDGRPAMNVNELMAAMEIHIHQIYDFKIADPTAVKVYRTPLGN